ncbi:MAG: helix-turn-helix domain-containing protein, partial [Firmicutes bacterium]|nr:helix-turn-helix domain-containing protein [Bacillota bacterium]
MQITKDVAQAVVERFASTFEVGMDITNGIGVVMAGTNPARRSMVDKRAALVVKREEPWEETNDRDTKAKVYLPIFFDAVVVGVVITYGLPELARPIARLAKSVTEMVLHQTSRKTRKVLSEWTLEGFTRDLLYGDYKQSPSMEKLIRREAMALGYNLDIPRVVLAIEVSNLAQKALEGYSKGSTSGEVFSSQVKDDVIQLLRSGEEGELVSFVGRQHFAVLTAGTGGDQDAVRARIVRHAVGMVGDLEERLGLQAVVGIGRVHCGVIGMTQSFTEASKAITLGKRLQRDKKVHHIDELGVAGIISLIPTEVRRSIIEEMLSRARDYRALDAELLHTAEVFCRENLNASHASEALFIHRNTLMYRLAKIK